MKRLALLFSIIVLASGTCLAQTTGSTYQGKLADAGAPATGPYDLTFRLFPIVSGGAQIGADVARAPTQRSHRANRSRVHPIRFLRFAPRVLMWQPTLCNLAALPQVNLCRPPMRGFPMRERRQREAQITFKTPPRRR
jgi:hypothetical protein